MTIAVRAATPDDADSIVETSLGAWEEGFRGIVPAEIDPRGAWSRDRVRARLEDEGKETELTVGLLDGRVLGYMVLGPSRDHDASAGVGEIWALYVHPAAWRRGLGRALVEHALVSLAEARFRQVTLWTLAESRPARAFYEACGFVRDGAQQSREALGDALEIRYRMTIPQGGRRRPRRVEQPDTSRRRR